LLVLRAIQVLQEIMVPPVLQAPVADPLAQLVLRVLPVLRVHKVMLVQLAHRVM